MPRAVNLSWDNRSNKAVCRDGIKVSKKVENEDYFLALGIGEAKIPVTGDAVLSSHFQIPKIYFIEACAVTQTEDGIIILESEKRKDTNKRGLIVLVRTGTNNDVQNGTIRPGHNPPLTIKQGISSSQNDIGLFWFQNLRETLVITFSNSRKYLFSLSRKAWWLREVTEDE